MPVSKEVRLVYLVVSIAALSLALLAYERIVQPIYGAGATGHWLTNVLYGVTTIIFFGPAPSPATTHFALGVLLCAAPLSAYWIAVLTARYGDPVWGPAVTHALVIAPIYYLGSVLHMMAYISSFSPSAPSPFGTSFAPLHPAPAYPINILSSVQSTTGLIVVGEIHAPANNQLALPIEAVRFLRASHSLLGGVWIDDKVHTLDDSPAYTDGNGTPLGDSIYAAFVLQEAVRLNAAVDAKNALVIGLGTGISATAFARHGLATTVLEVDAAVYTAARTYFGLPDPGPGRVFLEDAGPWVAQRANDTHNEVDGREGEKFDVVVHDCFSGGGVPAHVFTTAFWGDLKRIMNPAGVVAVNFAGEPTSKAARAILLTLTTVFGECRAFHDSLEALTEQQLSEDFINMVYFCTPAPTLSFRAAAPSDFLNSYMRQAVLTTLARREVPLALLIGNATEAVGWEAEWVLTEANNQLGAWQKPEALKHWKLMRTVLPDVFWETY
ncbi:S-adenosyl-L-methionine-dependent methyltransferase [Athelia psychrophila]|uniref:S-adenosyl-L-methionine-dependent methyltransferase n=1 Tax=Athelia psychrophila TaxID=1759441 RepID=A0A166IVL1_9AGAM|nr:S-adenosyl-L-methionine-dependent methyltransferase [Fibularhizoctonia sp. CBS 109695]